MISFIYCFLSFSPLILIIQNEIKAAVYSKRQKLARAFDIMKVDAEGKEAVNLNRWVQVMKIVIPQKSDAVLDLLMKVLDRNADGHICEFTVKV